MAALDGGLRAARAAVERRTGGPLPTRVLLVAMGRLGGGELGYGSDADVMFVHDPLPGADPRQAEEAAFAVAGELRRLLAIPGPEPPLAVDADLRPEGRNGPLVRTLPSYAEYYARWSQPWEAQALTRAVPAAGDGELGERFEALVDPVRWPKRGLPESAAREIRRIKARVEAERLPRGADPHRHLKLGRGGLSDVEWTVQLLQLRHAGEMRVAAHALHPGRAAGGHGRRPRRAGRRARAGRGLDPRHPRPQRRGAVPGAAVRQPAHGSAGAGRRRAAGRLPAGLRGPARRRLPAHHAARTQRRGSALLRLRTDADGLAYPREGGMPENSLATSPHLVTFSELTDG